MAAKKKKAHKKHGKKKARKKSKRKGGFGGHTKKANYTARHHKAHTRAGLSYNEKAIAHIKAADIEASAKHKAKRGGKAWSCRGPVRSGCGGSGSRVVGKVRR